MDNITRYNSNYNDNLLLELYNVYLNKQRHKVKFEYKVELPKDSTTGSLELVVYFDGGSVLHEEIAKNIELIEPDAQLAFQIDNVNTVRLDINDLKIITFEDKEYILLEVRYFDQFLRSKYYLFNDNGDLLINNGSVIKDQSVHYVDQNGEELNIFYDLEEQVMAKYQDGEFYVLEVNQNNNKIDIIECKYYFNDKEFVREEINTYNNTKVQSTT